MQSVAAFFTSVSGMLISCALIILFAIVAYARLALKTRPLVRRLRSLLDLLESVRNAEALAQRYEELNRDISADPVVGHLWQEYAETFVMPHPEDHRTVIRNTSEASGFFNLTTIVETRINLRFYREVSNYLPGLGILGTFIGLTSGIYLAHGGLTTNDTDAMRTALGQLLSGASLAFWTSIVGLVCSLVYSYAEKRLDHALQTGIDSWCTGLDARLERITLEQLASEELRELKDQTHQLQRFNTDLAVSISTALDERLEQRFTPLLERNLHLLEGLREDQKASKEDFVKTVVEEFRAMLTGATGNEMAAITETLRALSGQLEAAAQSISGAGSSVGREFEEATRSAGEEIRRSVVDLTATLAQAQQQSDGAFKSAVSEIAREITALTLELRLAGTAAGQDLTGAAVRMGDEAKKASESMEHAAAQAAAMLQESVIQFASAVDRQGESAQRVDALTVSVGTMLDSLRSSLGALSELHRDLTSVATPLHALGESLTLTASVQGDFLDQLGTMEARIRDAALALATTSESLKNAWDNVQGRFEGVDLALAKSFTEINRGIDAYADSVRTFVTDLDANFSRATQMLSGAIDELSAQIEELVAKQ